MAFADFPYSRLPPRPEPPPDGYRVKSPTRAQERHAFPLGHHGLTARNGPPRKPETLLRIDQAHTPDDASDNMEQLSTPNAP